MDGAAVEVVEVEVLMPEEEEEAAPCLAMATGGAQAAVPTSLRPRRTCVSAALFSRFSLFPSPQSFIHAIVTEKFVRFTVPHTFDMAHPRNCCYPCLIACMFSSDNNNMQHVGDKQKMFVVLG